MTKKDEKKKEEQKCAFDEKRICTKECIARDIAPGGSWYAAYCKRGKFYL